MIIIGEKINGSIPRAAKAIAEHDEDYIREIARTQTHYGADYIDCCASVNEGALETLKWLMGMIHEESDLPICIDDPDPHVVIGAMEYTDRVGLINSISGEGDKMQVILPEIANTKWGVIALLSDDNGIPATVEGRLAVFDTIMKEVEKVGIDPTRIYIDPLVETLGANDQSMILFNGVCEEVKRRYPTIHITSGMSNISFGLPARKMINLAFMVLAMNAGMDSAIMDPTNRDMNGVLHAADALLGNDEFCLEYIDAYREDLFGKPQA